MTKQKVTSHQQLGWNDDLFVDWILGGRRRRKINAIDPAMQDNVTGVP